MSEKVTPDKIFGRLLVIEQISTDKYRNLMWRCLCKCGDETVVRGSSLGSGTTQSCGCLRREQIKTKNTTHGKYNHPLHTVWRGMITRCYHNTHKHYKNYGGRGIEVCREWRDSPNRFIEWAETHGYKKGLQLDRNNNNGNYDSSNCRFVSAKTNQNNKRNNRVVVLNGQSMTVTDAVECFSRLNRATVFSRLYRKDWSIEDALMLPIGFRRRKFA